MTYWLRVRKLKKEVSTNLTRKQIADILKELE